MTDTTTMMIIDQHASIRELLAASITSASGFEIVGQTGSGREAIGMCRSLRPGLVIIGLPLANINGAEFVEQLREAAPGCRTLVFSGLIDERHIAGVLRAGPDGFVDRSEPLAGLWGALAATARGAGYFSATAAHLLRQTSAGKSEGREFPGLSSRECEVLALVAQGLTSKAISCRLGVAVRTVENHRARMKTKLGTNGVADLTRFALKAGFVSSG